LAHVERVGRNGVLFAHQVDRALDKVDIPFLVFGRGGQMGAAGDEFERLYRQPSSRANLSAPCRPRRDRTHISTDRV
jgi:hypothetical protein